MTNRAMPEESVVEVVTILNPQGLHARPAEMFVSLATKFAAKIDVLKDDESVDGKSILGVLTLLAEQGTELTIRATGPDAAEATTALRELVMSGFGDEPGASSVGD